MSPIPNLTPTVPEAGSAPHVEAARLRQITLHWALFVFALFLVSTVLGIFMRLFQSKLFPNMEPVHFYSALTLHALGMVAAWFVGGMAAVSYLLARYVRLSVSVSKFALYASAVGVLAIVACTMFGSFGVGWYFLFPLPLYPNGVWRPWATATFFAGLAVLGVAWLIWALDVLRAIGRRFSLPAALGWHTLAGRGKQEVPPIVLIVTVSLLVVVAALISAVIVLVLFLVHWSGTANVDALLMKNLTFLFGHSVVNITLYLGVAVLYELLPGYAGRPWKMNKLVAAAWNLVLLLVLFAYFHHLYMDFAQPRWMQLTGQIASYSLSLPAAAVTIFGVLALIYHSGFRWTLASSLMVLGVLGWAIGGIAAVIDATVAVNYVFHNTLWVPAHFHTYYLVGVVLMILGFFDHLTRELSPEPETPASRRSILAHLLIGGYGFLAMFYLGGAASVPRRFATYPDETAIGVLLARISILFALTLLGGILAHVIRTGRRCLRSLSLPA
ncbi:MAG: cbb3-type cytochrome c oxidase subunit I [Bryobacterales bacterium]|nr:cbb3-type cytochrome c oxidase subunit I [Bryobacterales bacterium]